jgi:hypothetical protein
MLLSTWLKLATSQTTLTAWTYLPEIESFGVNFFKRMLILLFNRLLEGSDGLGAGDFDRKGASHVVVFHNTVKIEA